ncbi:MAG: flagellar biosynthetic protein FliR [Spirochaetaceae bacterium]|nr:flagellar biosynthetic protein FliR [Spirochaetaceae bacterium]
MLNEIVQRAPLFLLVAVRCFALLMTLPLFSMQNVSRIAKIALAGYMAFIVLPSAYGQSWQLAEYHIAKDIFSGAFSLHYIFLLIGEGLIGVITGFYISMIFAAFSSAGQFFSYQMGFAASEVYDALAQIENPLMGQYLNLLAMLLFIQVDGFQELFLGGILRSFESLNAFSLVFYKNEFITFLLTGLTDLFFDAMMISLPLVGTLFLISVTMGILSKAAPQMNLLSEGLPLTILTSFLILFLLMPVMCDFFTRSFDIAFFKFEDFLSQVKRNPL